MRTPENRFEFEPSREPEPELDLEFCLRRLTTEVVGREIDTTTDRYLIQQVNASFKKNTPQGSSLECLVRSCAAECILVKKRGILQLVSQSGRGVCEQK